MDAQRQEIARLMSGTGAAAEAPGKAPREAEAESRDLVARNEALSRKVMALEAQLSATVQQQALRDAETR